MFLTKTLFKDSNSVTAYKDRLYQISVDGVVCIK